MAVYEGMSMRGSGIYSYDTQISLICEVELYDSEDNVIGLCDFDGDADATVDDWGIAHATCPKCGHEHEIDGRE